MAFSITSYRLHNQRLSQTDFTEPVQVVDWFGAVQSQDFAGGKWAIGLRTKGLTEADVERAFADGLILRTHVMRPTWHFVTPADIRWMLALTAPRVRALMAFNDRQIELDKVTLKKSNDVLVRTLQGGKQLTRLELSKALQKNKINTDELRLTHIVMHAELDGIVCSGARQGKQFTYALLEERVPQAEMLEHDEAVVELARRYFRSHGPATLKDFIWWSGLSSGNAKRGLETIKSELEYEIVDGETFWFSPMIVMPAKGTKAYLLPNYDEYTVGYTNRSAIFDTAHADKLDSRGSVLAQHVILSAGRITASWKRTLEKKSVAIETTPFLALKKTEMKAIIQAAERYANFLNLPFSLDFKDAQ
jgi:Winged helix DNA-binding domain